MSERQYCSSSTLFSDDYELFIDHGNGQRTKLDENEETFRDLQLFLLQQSTILGTSKEETKPVQKTISIDDPIGNQMKYPQTSMMDSSSTRSSTMIQQNIIYNQTWLSNKADNSRVMSSISSQAKPLKTCRFGFRIAVNGASKSLRSSTIPSANTSLIRGDFGDDAGIIVKTDETCFVGLADGAGGNRALGLDPADFSNGILSACRKVIEEKSSKAHQLPEITLAALEKVKSSTTRGSGTLCLLALNRNERILTSLNIGDSGYVIYRKNRIFHRSQCTNDPENNGPRQLFVLDHSIGLPSLESKKDILDQSSFERVRVEKDDLIILSSDGLWDVIQCDQLDSIVQHHQDLPNLAEQLLKFAMRGYLHHGRDDILIIVCQVEEY